MGAVRVYISGNVRDGFVPIPRPSLSPVTFVNNKGRTLEYGIKTLLESDAVFFVEGWNKYEYCVKEKFSAMVWDVPMFFEADDLLKWLDEQAGIEIEIDF